MNLENAFHFLGLDEHSDEDERFAAYQETRARFEDKLAKAPTEGLKQKYRDGLLQLDEAIEAVENRVDEVDLPPLGSSTGDESALDAQAFDPISESHGQLSETTELNQTEESDQAASLRPLFWIPCLASLAGAAYFGNQIWSKDQGGWHWAGLLGLGFLGVAFGMEAPTEKSRSSQSMPAEFDFLVKRSKQGRVFLATSTWLGLLWIATWFVDPIVEFKPVAGYSAIVIFLLGCFRTPSDESLGEDKGVIEAVVTEDKTLTFGKTVVLLVVWGLLVNGLGAQKWSGDSVSGAYDTVKGWVSDSSADQTANDSATDVSGNANKTASNKTHTKTSEPSQAAAGTNGSISNFYVVFRAGHERSYEEVPVADRAAFDQAILNGDRNFGERDTVWTYQSNVIEIPFRVSMQPAKFDLGDITQAMGSLTKLRNVMDSKAASKIDSWTWSVTRKKEFDKFNIVRHFWTKEAAESWRNGLQLQTFYPTSPPSIQ